MLPMQTKSILFFIPRVILLGCKDSIFAAAAEGLRDDTVQIRCLTAAVRRRISYPFLLPPALPAVTRLRYRRA